MSGFSEVMRFGLDLVRRTRDHQIIDMAAKIAYYSFLSLFPLILILFALAGMVGGQSAFDWTMGQLQSIMPHEAAEYVGGFVYEVTAVERPDVLSLSLLFLVFSASGALIAVIDSLNVVFEIEESRPLWRQYVVGMVSVVLAAVFFVVGLPTILVSHGFLDTLGLGWIWGRLYWPLVFSLLTSILWLGYIRLPNHRRVPSLLVLLVGALVGTGLWALVTQGLQLYLANFKRFASIYGVVTGIIVTLMWLHMTAFSLLFGAQVAQALAKRIERREAR